MDENPQKEMLKNLKQCYEENGLKFKGYTELQTDSNPIFKFVNNNSSLVSVQQLNNVKFMLKVKQFEEECGQCNF